MNVVYRTGPEIRRPTVKEAIRAKMKVPREFYVVDQHNEREIKALLQDAVKAEPDKDYEHVLDRVAHTLIAKKLE